MSAPDEHDASFDLRVGEARERETTRLTQRERLTRGSLAAGFVLAAVALTLLSHSTRHPPWWAYLVVALAYAAASRVRFEVATGIALPTVVVLVPALFILPAADVPLVVLAGSLIASVAGSILGRRPILRSVFVAAGSCWFALGPALVFVAAGEPKAAGSAAGVTALAIVAQLVFDAGASSAGEWFALGIHPRELVQPFVAAFTIDVLLAPLGFFVAVAERTEVWALLVPAPLLGLLIFFARDRRARLDHVLDLLTEVRAQHVVTQGALDRSVEAEGALRDSEARFRQLAEAIPVVFFLFGLDPPETLYVSPAYAAVWGRPVSNAHESADAWQDAVHPDDLRRVQREFAGATTGVVESSFRVVRPDGEIRWVVQQLFPVRDASGATIRVAGVAQDLSEQRTLEDQLRQSQKMEAIGQLAGGVAHDFNNLLTAISGYAELTLLRVDDERTRSNLKEITGAAARAAGLTKQILAFSRRQVMQPEVVDLNGVTRETEGFVRRLLGANVNLRLELATGLAPILADAGQLGQVVMNLVINARDAMPNGGFLTVRTENVELAANRTTELWGAEPGPYVRLTVRDTGTGMDAETRRRIFEPFFTTKDPGKGTGLGLSTCYGIVKQSNGFIDVESELGVGTAFVLHFPVTDVVAEAKRAAAPDDGTRHEGARVLLVEDEPVVRMLAEEMLESEGFVVRALSSPAEAIAAFEDDGPFDVLVTDLSMPQMTGRELVARLGELGSSPPVVYMSGYSTEVLDGGPLGAHFVQKPFSTAHFTETIRAALDERLVSAGDLDAA